MGKWDKGRAALYVMVGGYLIYLAYKLFTTRSGYEGANATVMLVFAVFFSIIGAVILGIALYMAWKDYSQNTKTGNAENSHEEDDVSKEDENI